MATLARVLKRANDRAGQALVEYSLVLCLVVLVLIMVVMVMGNQVKNLYCNVSGGLGS